MSNAVWTAQSKLNSRARRGKVHGESPNGLAWSWPLPPAYPPSDLQRAENGGVARGLHLDQRKDAAIVHRERLAPQHRLRALQAASEGDLEGFVGQGPRPARGRVPKPQAEGHRGPGRVVEGGDHQPGIVGQRQDMERSVSPLV